MSLLKSKKLLSGVASVAIGLSMVVAFATPASAALTTGQVDSIISLLQSFGADTATIANVRTSLTGGTPASGSGTASGYTFTRDLTIGSTGEDVRNLQWFLNANGFQVASSGAGSSGSETTYFGNLTRVALGKFQASKGIAPTAGYFGPKTRAVVNGTVSTTPGTPGTPTTPSGTGLTVSSATQPTASLAPESANRIPFTKVTLTASSDGDVTVNGVTVERAGLASDSVFSGISLLDENGIQLGIAKTLNSNHQVTVGDSFVVKAGTSKTVTIAGNMVADNSTRAGQVVSLAVVAVNTPATVNGSFPINGANHTINATLDLGTATLALSSFDPNSTGISKEIGLTNYKFAGIRVTAGSAEKVRLYSVRWNQTGSAGSSDLSNVKTYVDGTAYDTVVSSDGKYYTATFGSGVTIDKGLAKEVYIQGDITGSGSSARTVQFDIYKATDIYMTGETYGYGLTATASANCNATASTATAASEFINSSTSCASSGTVGTPFFSASTVTISAGSVSSVTKALSVSAQNIAVNVSNQVLGGYEVDLKGEPISVQSSIFAIATTSGFTGASGVITNVSIYDENGTVVAGPVDEASTCTNNCTITFTDTITYPIGKHTYTLKGKIPTSTANGSTVIVSTTPSTQWTTVTGQTTGNTISLSTLSTAVTMNTMTVKAAALGISISTAPPAQTVITGSQDFTYANVLLDASQSGEDVRFSSLALSMTFADMEVTQVTGCQLFDGSNALNDTVVNPAGASDANQTFTFDDPLTVTKGTVKTLALKCDLATSVSANDDLNWGINATSDPTVTGVTSGATVAESVTAAAGQNMVVAANGSYTVTNDSSLLYKTAQAGTSNVELARLRFTAGASEAIYLKQIALELGNTASNSPADLLNQQVTLWNGATQQIGTAQFGVGASPDNATSTAFSVDPLIAAGESVVITVKGTLTAQNINDGTPGAFLTITYDGTNVTGTNGNYARGVSSQANIDSSTTDDFTSNGVRIYRTVPSIAVTSNGGTLGAGTDLYKFVVTNGNSRDVVFQKFTMSIATTGGATNGFILYGDGIAFNSSTSTVNNETIIELIGTQTSDAQIVPAKSSKTYILKASTAVDTASVSETIALALLADTSFPSQASLMGTVTLVEAGEANTDNIIWSPFSTTTPVATLATQSNLDWTNGYGMPGFPSNTAFPVQVWTRAN
ncbi:MAG: peptidoglycan-binding domain-containing protein [bacterium]|nr:peptidoglycan-binding domain-containing protein [bacterium]